VLNKPAYRDARSSSRATISAAARRANTRPGRSRISASHASISTSFADIFYNNCFKNGILPIVVPQEECRQLMDDAERGANATVTVDLESQTITGPDGGEISSRSTPSASTACCQRSRRHRPDQAVEKSFLVSALSPDCCKRGCGPGPNPGPLRFRRFWSLPHWCAVFCAQLPPTINSVTKTAVRTRSQPS
jgi:hypothetical protein